MIEERENLAIEERQSAPRTTSRFRWKWWVALVLAAAAGYVLYGQFGASAPKRERGGADAAARPLPVAAVPATQGDINRYLDAIGTVTPLATVTVRSRVDGQLLRVLFREGQTVKAGELLAEIDARPFHAQLAQAQGQMARDQALLKNAQIDLERYRTLYAQDSIARQQVDTQESLVRQYAGAVKADQGQVDAARLQLDYARITAPIGGRLGLRQIDPGNMVHAADAGGLVVITQIQPISVIFSIPQDELPPLLKRLHGKARLPVDAFDQEQKLKLARGELLTVDNQIDPATGTIKLRAQFPNADGNLFPNQFVNVRLLLDVQRGATIIPQAAVQRGTAGTFVYAVAEDKSVSVRPVVLGVADGLNVAVDSGLTPGQLVVVDGADKLRQGAKVDLVRHTADKAPDAAPAARTGGAGHRHDAARRQGAGP